MRWVVWRSRCCKSLQVQAVCRPAAVWKIVGCCLPRRAGRSANKKEWTPSNSMREILNQCRFVLQDPRARETKENFSQGPGKSRGMHSGTDALQRFAIPGCLVCLPVQAVRTSVSSLVRVPTDRGSRFVLPPPRDREAPIGRHVAGQPRPVTCLEGGR